LPDGTENPILGKFCRALQWYMFVDFMAVWSTYVTAIRYILWSFGIFYGHLVLFWSFGTFLVIWYFLWSFSTFYGHLVYFSRVGILYREKSGNPAEVSGQG
jgi:hypothetical protein